MNEYYVKVNFEKGRIQTNLKELVRNDYNSTKLNFTFDKEGRVLFKLLRPDNSQYVDEIVDNTLIFGPGILSKDGEYTYEISLYTEDGRLTDYATKSFEVRSELVNTDEIVEVDDRVPVLDKLINEANQVNNMDIDINTIDDNVVVEITKKDGSKESAVVSGGGGTSDYSLLNNKPSINSVVLEGNKTLDDLNIQPKGNYLKAESDPTVPLHVKNITEQNISNWNNKSEFSGAYNDLTNIPSNIAKTNENNNFSTSQTINGTLTINGDIVQNGASYETHAEQIYTEKDEIITRDGATGGLSANQLTGIRAKKYDGTNDGQLGFDASGTARVGDENDTQPLLTRDEIENLTDGQVLVWDGTKLRAVGSSDYVKNNDIASETTLGLVKAWTSTNEDGEVGLNISTEA